MAAKSTKAAPKVTSTGAVSLKPVKARQFLVIFSNGCKSVVAAKMHDVYKFQMEHPGKAKVKVIEIAPIEE